MRKFSKWLDGHHLFLPGLLFSPYYDRLDKRPGIVVKLFNNLLAGMFRIGLANKLEWDIRWRATSFPIGTTKELSAAHPPSIELLVVAAKKDFWLLKETCQAAINNSLNPVKSLTLIVPRSAMDSLPNFDELGIGVDIIAEEDMLSKELLHRLRNVMGTRSGWLLQQYLTIKFVEKSDAEGVLTLDADTVILQKTLWLDALGRQVLHVSSEFVPQYYKFLHYLGASAVEPMYTHVTHHMLMQPTILRQILKSVGLSGSDDVLDKALSFSGTFGQREFCLEFELYAQGCKKMFADRLELVKFGNRSVRVNRQSINSDLQRLQDSTKSKFRSVSAHSYAQ